MTEVRLQKYLAEAGVASRRKCEELIAQGKIEINGEVITTQGIKVKGDEIIKVDGRLIRQEQKKVYILLNKPVGYISTAKDEFSRKTVLDLVDTVKERVYPVGRLDYDTSGLLLLTNDGELANRLTHPKHEIKKVYRAMIDGGISEEDVNSLQSGIAIEDYKTAPAKVHVIETAKKETIVEITIHEGRNRQVRKMFETLGYAVLRLKRVAIGPLEIEGIEEGKWRYLRKKEIDNLKKTAGLV
jgi:23S rRNA pseudouridine2605 synthase